MTNCFIKTLTIICFFPVIILSCKPGEDVLDARPYTLMDTASQVTASMTLEELAAQTLIISPSHDTKISWSLLEWLHNTPPGGVILLGGNIGKQTSELRAFLRTLGYHSRGTPLFIAIDHEGGTVNRLRHIAPPLANASELGRSSVADARQQFSTAASFLSSLGINMNFAPIMEPLLPENQEFLRYRAFHSDPDIVYEMGSTMISAMLEYGVLPVAKHFPGSGNGDPHYTLPLIQQPINSPMDKLVRAFTLGINNSTMPALMAAHVSVPSLDRDYPASISQAVLSGFLREQSGYQGLIITDDIYMKGMTANYPPEQTAVLALKAGADMILAMGGGYRQIQQAIVEAVNSGELPRQTLQAAVQRIVEAKLALIQPPIE
ncbi:MAG: hypothetical protein D6B26_07660 [Spirochaetaceae bacterium]|nr:MAG: hypothetical protein D6B26_07660 [Spirochaetaceae bacterium]